MSDTGAGEAVERARGAEETEPGTEQATLTHAWLKDQGRAEYTAINDDEALDAFQRLARTEGMLPAIESSHAIAHAMKAAKSRKPDDVIVVCLSGRGDKDVYEVARLLGQEV